MYCADVYMFFFFFKQKTAYEMRISDWSSDVCSSDLGRISVAEAQAAHYLARSVGLEQELASQAAALRDEAGKMQYAMSEQLQARDRQIGRASSRERVC